MKPRYSLLGMRRRRGFGSGSEDWLTVAQFALVFGAALVVRLVYASQVSASPLFGAATIDAAVYYDLAREFAAGIWRSPVGEPYWQPPFYPVALALWMKAGGPSVAAAKVAQMALGSVNCALTALIGSMAFNRRVGLIAGLMAAFYGPLVYFDGELLPPTLQIFLNLSAIVALLRAVERESVCLFAAAGLILGLSIITRPDTGVFAAGALVWVVLALRRRARPAKLAASCAALAVCAALPVVPVAVRNAVVGKDRVLVSSNGGLNFYIGNNPDEERTREIRPGPDWDAMQALPMRDQPNAKPSEQSAWFYRKSLSWAASHPLDYARLLIKKCVMYVSAVEPRRNHDLYHYRRHSPLYAALLWKVGPIGFPFGIVLPLAVLGMLRATRQPRPSTADPLPLLLWYLGAMFAATTAFFVTARYRAPAVPALLVFAGFGAAELWGALLRLRTVLGRDLKSRPNAGSMAPPSATASPLLAALTVLVLSNLNICRIDTNQARIDADTRLYLANILAGRGNVAAAYRNYSESIRLKPDYEPSRFEFALLLERMGRTEDAKAQLRACLRLDPKSPASNAKLGEILMKEGELAGALRHYLTAVRVDPQLVEDLVTLAENAYAARDYATAERALRAVVGRRPRWAEARRSLGVALMKLGRMAEARRELEEAVRLDPSLRGKVRGYM